MNENKVETQVVKVVVPKSNQETRIYRCLKEQIKILNPDEDSIEPHQKTKFNELQDD